MVKLFPFFMAALVGFTLWISCGKSTQTAGKVGSEKISLLEFEEYLSQRFPNQTVDQISFEDKKKTLVALLEGRLKYLKAGDLGYDKKPEFVDEFNRRRDRAMAGKLPEILIADKLVTPQMTRAHFNLQHRKANLSIITLGYRESKLVQAQRSLQETVDLANELYKRVQSGANTSELSEEFSDNPNIREKKGLVEDYVPGTFDPELDVQIFEAKENQVLPPLVTRRGVFIFNVLSKKEAELPPASHRELDRVKWQIYNKFYRLEGDSIFKDLTEKFKNELGWEISQEGIAQFVTAIEEWSKQPNLDDRGFPEAQREIYLGKVGKMEITAGYLIDEFQGTFRTNYTRYNNPDALNRLLTDYIGRFLAWVIKAKEQKIDRHPDIQDQLKKFRETKLVELFDKYEIREKATPSPEEVVAFYEKNPGNYVEPARIQMWEIALKDEATARTILAKARQPRADFMKLAEKYTEKSLLKSRGGDLGYQSIKSPRLVVKEAFSAGSDKIIGPIKEDKFYYVIKTGNQQPERQKPLSEVEPVVKSAVQREKEEKIRQEITANLKNEYPIWINENLLKKSS